MRPVRGRRKRNDVPGVIGEVELDAGRVARLVESPGGGLRLALVDVATGQEFGSIPLADRSEAEIDRAAEAALSLRAEIEADDEDGPVARVRAVREGVLAQFPEDPRDGVTAAQVLSRVPSVEEVAALVAGGQDDDAAMLAELAERRYAAALRGVPLDVPYAGAVALAPAGSFATFLLGHDR